MAERGNFNIQVSATDHATATLKALNKQLEHLRAPAEALHRQVRKFAELSGLRTLGEHAKKLAEGGREVVKQMAGLVAPLAAITGAASIAGMVSLVTEFGELSDKLSKNAELMGILPSKLHALEGGARLAGASAGSLTAGLENLSELAHSAAWGQSPELANYFNVLHVSLRNANGTIKTADELLPDLADSISRLKDPQAQLHVALKTLGSAGRDLLPFLKEGAAGIERWRKESERLNPITKDQIEKGKEFRLAWEQLNQTADHLKTGIIVGLVPAFKTLVDQFTAWLNQHPDLGKNIADGILRVVQVVQGAWPDIKAFLDNVGSKIAWVVDKVGGWQNAAEILIGAWALAKFAPLFLVLERIAALAIAATASLVGLGAASRAAAAAAVPAAAAPAAAAGGGRLGAALLGGFLTPAGLAIGGLGAWFGLTSQLRPGGVKPVSPQQSEMPSSTQAPMPYQQIVEPQAITAGQYEMEKQSKLWRNWQRPAEPFDPGNRSRWGASPLGPAARGTQADPFYVRPADVQNPFGAGSTGPGTNRGQTMPGLGGMWGQANKLLSLSQRSATTGVEMAKWMMGEFGWSKRGAAGVIGSMIQESGLNPGAVAPGGDTGLWQATEDRKARLFAMAQRMGKPWQDLEVQKAWFKEQMNTPGGRALAAQIKAHPETSAPDFYRTFERTNFHPNDPSADPNSGRNPWEIARRSGNAQQFLERYLKDERWAGQGTAGAPSPDAMGRGEKDGGKIDVNIRVSGGTAHTKANVVNLPRIEEALPAYGL